MQTYMTETERWRSTKVAELNGKLQDIANRRGDILHPYRQAGPGHKLPEDVRTKLDALEGESARVQQQIHEVELEAARREREPVDPTPAIRELTEELAREKVSRENALREFIAKVEEVKKARPYLDESGAWGEAHRQHPQLYNEAKTGVR